MTRHIEIIAEIGCNHNGDKEIAKQMVRVAKECGVDAVKFQTFSAEALISQFAPKAEYQKTNTGADGTQLEMTKKLELTHDEYIELKDYAISLGLKVFSTPFDMESVDFLASVGQSTWKIPSGEITNLPFLQKIGALKCENKKIILSTGMSTIDEARVAIKILVDAGTAIEDIVLLHCNTEYPSPDEDINLRAIDHLEKEFPGMYLGFSDHSVGAVAATAAATKNIVLIEKHFTLDKNLPGPDHKASATPEELTELCTNVRRVQVMLGEGAKVVTKSEKRNKTIARKSIVARTEIKKGDILTEDNITCKRPGNGISPMHWYEVLGTVAIRDFIRDELIEADGIEWENDK